MHNLTFNIAKLNIFHSFTAGIKFTGLKYIHKVVQPLLYLVLEHFRYLNRKLHPLSGHSPLHSLYSAVSADVCIRDIAREWNCETRGLLCRLLPLRIVLSRGIHTTAHVNAPFLSAAE